MPRERWLEKRKEEILPVSYFHVVFTRPHELNTVILNDKKVMLNILFAAASRTLMAFGKDKLNGILGFLANRDRNENLNVIRRLMDVSTPLEKEIASLKEMVLQLTGMDIMTCPCCSKRKMQFFAEIPKGRARPPSHLTRSVG